MAIAQVGVEVGFNDSFHHALQGNEVEAGVAILLVDGRRTMATSDAIYGEIASFLHIERVATTLEVDLFEWTRQEIGR